MTKRRTLANRWTVVALLAVAVLCLYWGYSLALLRMMPCDNVFRFDAIAGCAEPLYWIYVGYAFLIGGAGMGLILWLKSL